jgi:hypothetical protein
MKKAYQVLVGIATGFLTLTTLGVVAGVIQVSDLAPLIAAQLMFVSLFILSTEKSNKKTCTARKVEGAALQTKSK